jgi:hypothetical protein
MIRFFKNLFKAKDPGPAPEAPYKVEAVNAQPIVTNSNPADNVTLAKTTVKKEPAKKRTFVKREDSGVAKVAPVKAKPKAPAKPKAK